MYLNSYMLARTVRRFHRGQSITLPLFQQSTTTRDRRQWQDSRSFPHSGHSIRPLDIKTISFQATEQIDEISTSFYNEGKLIPGSLNLQENNCNPTTAKEDIEDMELDLSQTSSSENISRGSTCGFIQPKVLGYSNKGSETGTDHQISPYHNSTAKSSYESDSSFLRKGVRASMSTTRINVPCGFSSLPPNSLFSRSGSSVPSLLYSLPIQSSVLDSIPDRDWNQEFNEVLESPLLERAEKLRNLEKEFVEVATKIGKIIISEKNVHQSQKTVKAISSKGIAGGEKYQVKGIFFKFAVDKSNLYGSDESAMKVACHELKGHTALVSCGMTHGLKLGLMTIIDYQGYRLTAVSVLPISTDTLIYGSADGGTVVYSSLEAMNNIMRQCGKVLNLKGHVAGIGTDKKFLYGPCDLEGHLGRDGHLYVIDLARLFPPETPKKSVQGGFLYRLLRPELVRQYKHPLSSDAFTRFGAHDSEIHDAEVRKASCFLHDEVIPNFAASLEQNHSHANIDKIILQLHRAGINIRYLGEVRSYITSPNLRKTLLTEIFARTFKNEIRKKLRDSRSINSSSHEQLCINLFNAIFSSKPISGVFWKAIKKNLHHRFIHALFEEEKDASFEIRERVDLESLFYRLQEQVGVRFNASFSDVPLSSLHFEEFVVQSKQMYTIPRIEADTAAELARKTKDISEVRRLLSLARKSYNSVLELKPDDNIVLSNLGMVLAQSALLELNENNRKELFMDANEKFSLSLQFKNDDPHTLVMWGDSLINQVILGDHSYELIDNAVEMSLQAEKSSQGIAALVLARAYALKGDENNVKMWLSCAVKAGQLSNMNSIVHDPAFHTMKSFSWFSSLHPPC